MTGNTTPPHIERERWTEVLHWSWAFDAIAQLTEREREVLILLGKGCDNRAISTTLGVGERTVKAHITSLMRKLGVSSRLQAGLVAVEHQLASELPEGRMAGRDIASYSRSGSSGNHGSGRS